MRTVRLFAYFVRAVDTGSSHASFQWVAWIHQDEMWFIGPVLQRGICLNDRSGRAAHCQRHGIRPRCRVPVGKCIDYHRDDMMSGSRSAARLGGYCAARAGCLVSCRGILTALSGVFRVLGKRRRKSQAGDHQVGVWGVQHEGRWRSQPSPWKGMENMNARI